MVHEARVMSLMVVTLVCFSLIEAKKGMKPLIEQAKALKINKKTANEGPVKNLEIKTDKVVFNEPDVNLQPDDSSSEIFASSETAWFMPDSSEVEIDDSTAFADLLQSSEPAYLDDSSSAWEAADSSEIAYLENSSEWAFADSSEWIQSSEAHFEDSTAWAAIYSTEWLQSSEAVWDESTAIYSTEWLESSTVQYLSEESAIVHMDNELKPEIDNKLKREVDNTLYVPRDKKPLQDRFVDIMEMWDADE